MWTIKSVIVFIMLLVPSLCNDPPKPDLGSPEEFLKEVNEYRAKFAKEYKIPNMYKLHRNLSGLIDAEFGKFKNQNDLYKSFATPIEFINPLQTFIDCSPEWLSEEKTWQVQCSMGFRSDVLLRYADAGEAGSQCPPRFEGENGLCVPVDPSKHTFWGTEEQLLEDVNYMRRKYAKKYEISNMHQLTWNESLVEVLKSLDLKNGVTGFITSTYLSSSDSSWDGFGKNWRLAELLSFSAAVAAIDEAFLIKFVLSSKRKISVIRGREESTTAEEFINPLQISIGCMKKEVDSNGRNSILTACLLGNMGQSDWKIDVEKIPGSECMDSYVNDDGLCSIPLPTTTPEPVPNTPKNTVASIEKKKKEGDAEKEEALESSVTTRNYSYGLLILMFIRLLF